MTRTEIEIRKYFRECRERLEDLEKKEAEFKTWKSQVDWNDPDDVRYYRNNRHRQWRDRAIKAFAPNRHCPRCGLLVVSTSAWVIFKKRNKVMGCLCKACASVTNIGCEIVQDIPKPERILFVVQTDGIYLYGRAAGRLRLKLGLSLRRFSQIAGWSAPYQKRLEGFELKRINAEQMEGLTKAFNRFGCETIIQ